MAIAKGMTNRKWEIYHRARCLQYLLTSVMESVDNMRTSMIENISKLAETESEGDPEIRHECEQYYLNVFNTSIPDDMEQIFLQSMVTQKEKNKSLGPITEHIPDWSRFYDMRNDIALEGYTTEHLTQQYIEKTIEEARAFLMTVDNA